MPQPAGSSHNLYPGSGSETLTNDGSDTVTPAIASGQNPGNGTLSCTGGLTATVSAGVASFNVGTIDLGSGQYYVPPASGASEVLSFSLSSVSYDGSRRSPCPAASWTPRTSPSPATASPRRPACSSDQISGPAMYQDPPGPPLFR